MKQFPEDPASISVLLPSLAKSETLKTAILSTLRALDTNDELLVMIQGSEQSPSDIESIQDSRLRVFLSPSIDGVAIGLNSLLAEAKNPLVARMDSDDICLPWRFKIQRRKLLTENLDFVFSNSVLFGKKLNIPFVLPQIPYGLSSKLSGLELILRNPFVHPTMLARKEILDKLGGYRRLIAEDYDLWMRAYSSGARMARSNHYVLLYRVHENQVSKKPSFLQKAEAETGFIDSKNQLANKLRNEFSELAKDFSLERVESLLSSLSLAHRTLRSKPLRFLIKLFLRLSS